MKSETEFNVVIYLSTRWRHDKGVNICHSYDEKRQSLKDAGIRT